MTAVDTPWFHLSVRVRRSTFFSTFTLLLLYSSSAPNGPTVIADVHPSDLSHLALRASLLARPGYPLGDCRPVRRDRPQDSLVRHEVAGRASRTVDQGIALHRDRNWRMCESLAPMPATVAFFGQHRRSRYLCRQVYSGLECVSALIGSITIIS
jgi:hypothetical protein